MMCSLVCRHFTVQSNRSMFIGCFGKTGILVKVCESAQLDRSERKQKVTMPKN